MEGGLELQDRMARLRQQSRMEDNAILVIVAARVNTAITLHYPGLHLFSFLSFPVNVARGGMGFVAQALMPVQCVCHPRACFLPLCQCSAAL